MQLQRIVLDLYERREVKVTVSFLTKQFCYAELVLLKIFEVVTWKAKLTLCFDNMRQTNFIVQMVLRKIIKAKAYCKKKDRSCFTGLYHPSDIEMMFYKSDVCRGFGMCIVAVFVCEFRWYEMVMSSPGFKLASSSFASFTV